MNIVGEIRGEGFRPPAKAIIAALRPGASLQLVREPTNKFDPWAVQVWVKPTAVLEEDRGNLELGLAGYGRTLEEFDEPPAWFIGYVGKEWARELSPALEQEGMTYEAKIAFNGKGKPVAEIEVTLP
jgi:hypothetical protein